MPAVSASCIYTYASWSCRVFQLVTPITHAILYVPWVPLRGRRRLWLNEPCPQPGHSRVELQVRLGLPATQWITVYNAHRPMKQRYHYNVANVRVEQHVVKGNDDGLYISSVACCQVHLPSPRCCA